MTIAGRTSRPFKRIALLQHLKDRARFGPIAFEHPDGLVEFRIERLADRVELNQVRLRERVEEQLQRQLDAVGDRSRRACRLCQPAPTRPRVRGCRRPAAARSQTVRARICARFRRRVGRAGGRFRIPRPRAAPARARDRPPRATHPAPQSAHRPSAAHPRRRIRPTTVSDSDDLPSDMCKRLPACAVSDNGDAIRVSNPGIRKNLRCDRAPRREPAR